MRSAVGPAAVVPATLTLLGVPATRLDLVPPWVLILLVAVTIALAVTDAVVTQIIRLRVSTKVTRSRDATTVLDRYRRR